MLANRDKLRSKTQALNKTNDREYQIHIRGPIAAPFEALGCRIPF